MKEKYEEKEKEREEKKKMWRGQPIFCVIYRRTYFMTKSANIL